MKGSIEVCKGHYLHIPNPSSQSDAYVDRALVGSFIGPFCPNIVD